MTTKVQQELQFRQRKNFIINGNFDRWQRGTSFTALGGGAYTADRWKFGGSGGTAGTYTISKQLFNPGQIDVPNNPKCYLNWNQTIAPTEAHAFSQPIEDVFSLAGQIVTISIWARLKSGTFNSAIQLIQDFGVGGSASIYHTPIPNFNPNSNWQKFVGTILLPNISGKILGDHSYLLFYINIPSSGTWDLDIAQIQVENSSVATDFEYKNPREILADCQRYYEIVEAQQYLNLNPANVSHLVQGHYNVQKRTDPTITKISGNLNTYFGNKYYFTAGYNGSTLPPQYFNIKLGIDAEL